MRADELIKILRGLPADAEVVIALVEPVEDEADEISLKRFDLDLLLPEAEDGEAWLVVGEEADLDAFLDAIDSEIDEDDDDEDDDHADEEASEAADSDGAERAE